MLLQKGQLGHKDLQTRGTPTLVKDLAGIDVVAGDFKPLWSCLLQELRITNIIAAMNLC